MTAAMPVLEAQTKELPLEQEPKARPFQILLVEDNPGDVWLTREAFNSTGIDCQITICRTAVAARETLWKQNPSHEPTRPDLVLLDINLPGENAMKLLTELKEDSMLRRVPVLMLSSSEATGDIVRSYDSYANGYISKPPTLEQYFAAVQAIVDFWLRAAHLTPV